MHLHYWDYKYLNKILGDNNGTDTTNTEDKSEERSKIHGRKARLQLLHTVPEVNRRETEGI